jgi:hypothetical protein
MVQNTALGCPVGAAIYADGRARRSVLAARLIHCHSRVPLKFCLSAAIDERPMGHRQSVARYQSPSAITQNGKG